MRVTFAVLGLIAILVSPHLVLADLPFALTLQFQTQAEDGVWKVQSVEEAWDPAKTAVIVCDVWDQHHCLNAVRRLEQIVPRLEQVLTEARRRGATVIHAPSDCMDSYRSHPARLRAQQAPAAAYQPPDIAHWCSQIPAEELAEYPLDQSDGGEDDDPVEHAAWEAKLTAMGRNPALPWKSQHEGITIDAARDYISDRGDEIWNVLEARGLDRVILTGVHLNMCVLGRPFGLRQMARNGKRVVLMRDMTDTMYNPQRWPYVTHEEGTARMVAHVERHVCPTITSDQVLGGQPLELVPVGTSRPVGNELSGQSWQTIRIPPEQSQPSPAKHDATWYRCVLSLPSAWVDQGVILDLQQPIEANVWVNGQAVTAGAPQRRFRIPAEALRSDDANLLVIRLPAGSAPMAVAPAIDSPAGRLSLAGRWQRRDGEDTRFADLPLPAKFAASTDIVFTAPDDLFVARALTRPGVFTAGIEGPACDAHGNIYAVNFQRQGTIGVVTPQGEGRVFVQLPEGSTGNGIRFGPQGQMYVADYTGHNVLHVDSATRQVTVLAHQPAMHQPNDLAIAPDGALLASDPDWQKGTGQIWRIEANGTTQLLADGMGTTNGIEVSPDGKTLYVNESLQRKIWAFRITAEKELAEKRLLRSFDDHGFDGMRCDVQGNLYVTRYGKGTVVKLSPDGEILREIPLPGKRPSNICFGGPDGRTAYVTEVDYAGILSFRVDQPGLEWQRWQENK